MQSSRPSWLVRSVSCLALLLCTSWAVANTTEYESTRQRLIEISRELATLNARLQSELQASKQASETLRAALAISQSELETLRLTLEKSSNSLTTLSTELAELRHYSEEHWQQATLLAAESTTLSALLGEAELLLGSLRFSLDSYQREVRRLKRGRSLVIVGIFVAAALGIAIGMAIQ